MRSFVHLMVSGVGLCLGLCLAVQPAMPQQVTHSGSGGGGSTPAGSTGAVQYNNAGSLGGNTSYLLENPTAVVPTAPTVTRTGTAGAGTCGYKVAAWLLIGQTAPSTQATTTTCPAANSGGFGVTVTTAAVTGSTSCDVFLTTPAAGGTLGWIGNVSCGAAFVDTTGTGIGALLPEPGAGDTGTYGGGALRWNTGTSSQWTIGPPQTGGATITDNPYCNGRNTLVFPQNCNIKYYFQSQNDLIGSTDPASNSGDTTTMFQLSLIMDTQPLPGFVVASGMFIQDSTAFPVASHHALSAFAPNMDIGNGGGSWDNIYSTYNNIANEGAVNQGYIYGDFSQIVSYGGTVDKIAGTAATVGLYGGDIATFLSGEHIIVFNRAGHPITGNLEGIYIESDHNDGAAHTYGIFIDDDFAVTNGYQIYLAGATEKNVIEGDLSVGTFKVSALTGTKLPVCQTNGIVYAGTNTAGVLACP